MPKANLTLIGASLSLNAETARTALASECELSETELDAACKSLFELKEPYIVCKEAELAVVANHFARLKALGIDCEVEVLALGDTDDSSGSNVLRNCIVAAACVVCAGGGYFLHSQKTNQQSLIFEQYNAQSPSSIKTALETELTEFQRWLNRLNRIESLKRQLDRIPSDWYKAELIASMEDPLVRIVTANYVTQSAIQTHESGRDSQIAQHQKTLEASAAIIDSYPAPLDRFYASLDLAGVYQQLRQHNAAQSAFRLAENLVPEDEFSQRAQIVIAEVALAEYQHLYGRVDYRDVHLDAAMAAANGLGDDMQEWAQAYIARGEAKFGMFAKAHSRLKTITDEKIVDVVMDDISRYAAGQNNEPVFEFPDLTSRDFPLH